MLVPDTAASPSTYELISELRAPGEDESQHGSDRDHACKDGHFGLDSWAPLP